MEVLADSDSPSDSYHPHFSCFNRVSVLPCFAELTVVSHHLKSNYFPKERNGGFFLVSFVESRSNLSMEIPLLQNEQRRMAAGWDFPGGTGSLLSALGQNRGT